MNTQLTTQIVTLKVRALGKVLIALLLVSLAVLFPAHIAQADITFGTFGSAAGQTSEPRGLAVDESTGHLYVADRNNNRIDVFEADGDFVRAFGWGVLDGSLELQVCTTSCQGGIPGSGAGQLNGPLGIAVDNDPTSVAYRDVYVYDSSSKRVQRFHPNGEFVLAFGWGVANGNPEAQVCTTTCQTGIAGTGKGQFETISGVGIGPTGVIYVKDDKFLEFTNEGNKFFRRVQKINPSGTFSNELVLSDSQFGNPRGFAVDSNGNFYVGNSGTTGAVRKYSSLGLPLVTINPSFNISALTVDNIANVYAADFGNIGSVVGLNKYSPAGSQLRSFGYGSLTALPSGIAWYDSANGEIFASQGSGASSRIAYFASVPEVGPIVLPDPQGEIHTFAGPIGNVRATLNSTINPEGKATNYRFQYVDHATYLKDVEELGAEHGFDHAKEGSGFSIAGVDFKLHVASGQVGCTDVAKELPEGKCLTPGTAYHFRAIASNADGEDVGPEATFTTKEPVELSEVWSTEVGQDSAVLHAAVNPLGIPATGRFQYIDQASFAANGFSEAKQSPVIDFGAGESELSKAFQLTSLALDTTYRYRIVASNSFVSEIVGPEASFTTYAVVSQTPEECPNEEFRLGAVAKLPDCRAYEMVSPADKENGDIVVLFSTPDPKASAEIPQASDSGQRLAYGSYRSFADAIAAPYTVPYLATRTGQGWDSHSISPPRDGASIYNVVSLDTQFRAFSEDLCSGWIWTDTEPQLASGAIAGFGNLYRRQNCGEETYEALTTAKPPSQPANAYFPEVQGFTPDGGHTVFRANGKLTKEASAAKSEAGLNVGEPIYQLYGSQAGKLRLISVLPGGDASDLDSAAGTGGEFKGKAFRHDSLTHALSEDGSRVFWTAGSATGPGRIYLRQNPFSAGKECSGATSPCTFAVSEAVGGPGSTAGASFWLAAADGSRAIFSFEGGPLAGNLYEYDALAKVPQLIAGKVDGVVEASEDASKLYFISREVLAPGAVAGKANLYLRQAGEAPAIDLVATLSDLQAGNCFLATLDPFKRCTRVSPDGDRLAFPSRDSLTGYDNADAVSGKSDSELFLYDASVAELHCISCNPSGGRPSGRGVPVAGALNWLAAQLPTAKTAFYASRALSDDGRRLFFESYDSLLLRDTNGKRDLYLWEEAAGKEDCDEKGAELYVPSSGGCLSLISSGQGQSDVEFVDASSSGDDVFFKTPESLLAHDPGLIDIYDARVGGGFPPPPSPSPPCEGEACQPATTPPALATPSSSSFRGPANPEAQNPKPRCPKGKRRVRRAGKGRCVARQRKRTNRKAGSQRQGRTNR